MHIPQHNNNNQAIVDRNHDLVPLCYFNIIKLKAGESYSYQLADYETCIVPATGSIDVQVQNQTFKQVGKRQHIWERDPEGVYVPVNCEATIDCISEDVEVFISGAKHNQTHKAFVIREENIDTVQYGSDDTKTHRKIKHIITCSCERFIKIDFYFTIKFLTKSFFIIFFVKRFKKRLGIKYFT